MIRAVIDTNVVVAAVKSRRGASYEILRRADCRVFEPALSVPLIVEYEDVLSRPETDVPLSATQIDAILNRLCEVGLNQRIHFLWRPFLRDPKDDMVFETALASQAAFIITFNIRDFEPVTRFGIQPILPREFLLKL